MKQIKYLNKIGHSFIFVLFLLISSSAAYAQTTIKGKVTSLMDKEALIGVNIVVTGTSIGTISDASGNYTLTVPDDAKSLKFSYIGYNSETVAINGKTEINVQLIENIEGLNEIVVVGYGVQKKSDVTGAVISIDADKFADSPETNILQSLQGSMAGLRITVSGTDAEGASASMLIRGQNSITASNTPLIIIDGIPFSGGLSEVNPNDIKSIEVLKDASSAAIYGARGSNGVILITTKLGKEGEMKVSYDGSFSINNIAYLPDLMDGETFYRRKLEYGETFTVTEQENYDNKKFTNWIEEATQTGYKQNHNLSVSGGNENTKYFLSSSYTDVKGIAKNDNFNRLTMRVNIEQKLFEGAKLGTNTTIGFYDRSGLEADFSDASRMNPLGNPYNEDGSLKLTAWEDPNYAENPLNALNYINSDKTKRINTNNYIQIDIPFIEGLSYKLNTGYEYRSRLNQTYAGMNTYVGNQNNGMLEIFNEYEENWIVDNIVSYSHVFGKHSLFFTGLYSAQKEVLENNDIEAYNFPSDVLTYYQPNKALTTQTDADYTESAHLSQMLRVNYSFDSRYMLTLTARRDGYSAFGVNTKFGIFPSIAFGWNITNEKFLKSIETLNLLTNLKLRLSYGVNGNEAISPYSTLPNLFSKNYLTPDLQPAFGFYPKRLGNPNLGWETTKSFNLGVDFGLWNDRVYGIIDYYNSNTFDLLLDKTISPMNGDDYIRENIGETKNYGIEFQISSVNVKTGKFKWRTDFNIAHNKTEIVHIGLTDEQGNYIDDIASNWFIGEAIQVNYDYVFDGIWQENDDIASSHQPTAMPGDIKYKDVNDDGMISVDDKQIIGSRIPNFVAGLTNSFSYGNFTLSFLLNSVQGIMRRNLYYGTGQISFRVNSYDKNFWSPDNPNNEYPANVDRDVNPLDMNFYEDASFLRLQDISLSYKIPEKLLSKISAKNAVIYVNMKNAATWTKWTGLDPEFLAISPVNRQRSAPQVKSLLFGMRLSF